MTTRVLGNESPTSAASNGTDRRIRFGPAEAQACRALIDRYRDEQRAALFAECAANAGPKGGPAQPPYRAGPVTRYLKAKQLADQGHGPACQLLWDASQQRLVLQFENDPKGGHR